MAEMYGKQDGCSRGRGGSMHIFDAATRFYGGNAIVGGGLPLAVGLALADEMPQRPRGHRLLLRRRRGRGRRVPRIAESRGAVAAAGAVRLREQSLRDGHAPRALRVADRHRSRRRELRHAGATGRRHGCRSPSRRRPRAGGRRIRAGAGPQFLECTDLPFPRSFDVRRRALPRQGGSRGAGSSAIRSRCSATRARRTAVPRRRSDFEALERRQPRRSTSAVAFAEAGTWEPVEDLMRYVYTPT